MPDLGVFTRYKGFNDFQEEQQKNSLAQALAQAQIMKAMQPDADKLGEQAFLKAAQGQELTPQETAALKYLDAKSPTSAFNPVTGNMEVKPGLLDRAGLNTGGQPARTFTPPAPSTPTRDVMNAPMTPNQAGQVVDLFGGDGQPVNDAPQEIDPLEAQIAIEASKQRNAARGNPKLLQDIAKSENDAKLKIISDRKNKAEDYSKMLENTGLSELVQAAERANNVLPPEGEDIPGFGEWGAGTVPDVMISAEGVDTRQQISGLKNAILKARSGGAVTPSEADRMMTELGSGLGRSDKNLRQGIKNVTQMIQEKLTNVGGGFSTKTKDLYKQQGGTISSERLAKFNVSGNTPIVKTQAQFDALPSGARYIEIINGKPTPGTKP